MEFPYAKDADVDDKGISRMTMRPRIPIRISNVRPARRGGSDSSYAAEALADSGADTSLITREAADAINIDFGALPKLYMVAPFGRFEARRALVLVDIVHKGQRVGLGKTPATVPIKDVAGLGSRPFIVAGRSNIFNQYTVKFDDSREILTMERVGREADPRA